MVVSIADDQVAVSRIHSHTPRAIEFTRALARALAEDPQKFASILEDLVTTDQTVRLCVVGEASAVSETDSE